MGYELPSAEDCVGLPPVPQLCVLCGAIDQRPVPALYVFDGYSLCAGHVRDVLAMDTSTGIFYDSCNRLAIRATIDYGLAINRGPTAFAEESAL
jgi:hypothetical protein